MSTGGPSEAERVRSLRPWFFVAAMIAIWLMGVQGVTAGCGTVMFLRQGSVPNEAAAAEAARSSPDFAVGVLEVKEAARLRAVAEQRERTMPLAIGRAMLSLLLVVASAMVLSGRPTAKSLVLQALGANAAFGVLEYALLENVRAQWIGAIARADLRPQAPGAEQLLSPAFWYWGSRIHLAVVEVGVPLVAALAVLSRRTQAFFEAAQRAEQRREREDEP